MNKEQKTYSKEFKMEAVRLADTSGKPVTEIARDLCISDSTIHNWRKQLATHGEQAFPGSRHQTAEAEELRRLKRELEIVKQERDIGSQKRSWCFHDHRDEISVYRRSQARVYSEDDVSCA